MTSLLIDTHLNDIKIFLLEDGFVVDKKEVINNKDYYVLYEKTLDEGLKNYNESYRLRMWLKEEFHYCVMKYYGRYP